MMKTSSAPDLLIDAFELGSDELMVVPYEGEPQGWDDFVARCEGGTICHLAGWRRVMEKAFGHDTRYLVATDPRGDWKGVLPLVHVESALFGDYVLSMPFLNDGGPLGSAAACWALAEAARDEADARGADLLELRTRRPTASPLQVSNRKITVLLDLPDDAEELWMGHLRGKIRTMIRRPRKEGMTIRFGIGLLDDFYRVFTVNMRDLGTPVLPRRFFEEVTAAFADRVRIGAVYAGERPVAAGFGFVWQGEFEMTWASSLREYQSYTVNEFLYWSFMERLIHEGAHTFNFGRCTPGSGTHRWKSKWRGRDVPLPWLQWTPAATPSPEQPIFKAATWLWSRLPLAVANRVGPQIAPSLP